MNPNLQNIEAQPKSKKLFDFIRNIIFKKTVKIDSGNPPASIEDTQSGVTYIRFPDGFLHLEWKNKVYKVPYYEEIDI